MDKLDKLDKIGIKIVIDLDKIKDFHSHLLEHIIKANTKITNENKREIDLLFDSFYAECANLTKEEIKIINLKEEIRELKSCYKIVEKQRNKIDKDYANLIRETREYRDFFKQFKKLLELNKEG